MSTTTTTSQLTRSASSSVPSRTHSRLQRLRSLRTYSQGTFSSNNSGNHRSYRDGLSRAVGLSSAAPSEPIHETSSAAPRNGPEPPQQPTQPSSGQSGCVGSDETHQSYRLSTVVSVQSDCGPCSPDSHAAALSEPPQLDLSIPRSSLPSSSVGSPEPSHSADMAEQRSDVNGATPLPTEPSDSNHAELSSSTQRNINHNSPAQHAQSSSSGDDPASFTPPSESSTPPQPKPTIRFFAYQDPHHPRPSLRFSPMTRILSEPSSVIQVGRYSERSGPSDNPSEPSDAAVGFKSKVVSRKHCEFSISNGQWHIRDVGSSSGTFLNHMRLSPPNTASRLYVVRDGDIVQLGIDFRGGEEMVYRSVRFRIECNRSWQQRPNEFNKNTENLINSLGKGADADFSGCRECSICLGSVLRPYQCLFMAACAHVWHYKCIRRLIHTQEYPMFQCPNCRAYTDLSAEVDDTNDNDCQTPLSRDQPVPSEITQNQQAPESGETPSSSNQQVPAPSEDEQLAAATATLSVNGEGSNNGEAPQRSATIAVPNANSSARDRQCQATGLPEVSNPGTSLEDNPMTPRNDAGLLAFDGRAVRM